MKLKQWGFFLLAAVSLCACVITLQPVWTYNLDSYLSDNYIYPAQDGQSFYLLGDNFGGSQSRLLHMDFDGNLLSQLDDTSNPLTDYSTLSPAQLRLKNDKAALIAGFTNNMLFADPAQNGLYHGLKGLTVADDETLRIESVVASDDDQLVFTAGPIKKDARPQQPYTIWLGIADAHGNVLRIENHPELAQMKLFREPGNPSIVAVTQYRDDANNPSAMPASIQILDSQLNLVHEQPLLYAYSPTYLIHGHLMEYGFTDVNPAEAISITDGTITTTEGGYDDTPIADATGYYQVGTRQAASTSVTLKDGTIVGFTSGQNVKVCHFNRDFVRQWCHTIPLHADDLYLESIQLTSGGNLGFTTNAHVVEPVSAGLSVSQVKASLLAGFDITGEESYTSTHYLYNNKGKVVKAFRETPYVIRGALRICELFSPFCVMPEKVQPGVCFSDTSKFIGDNELVALSDHCSAPNSRAQQRVSLFRW